MVGIVVAMGSSSSAPYSDGINHLIPVLIVFLQLVILN
jgi:hypothetical protein